MATKEYFPEIGKIKFEGKDSKNPLAYRYYDAEKVVLGKKMKDWLKFAMAWWHHQEVPLERRRCHDSCKAEG